MGSGRRSAFSLWVCVLFLAPGAGAPPSAPTGTCEGPPAREHGQAEGVLPLASAPDPAQPWTVFTPASSSLPMDGNTLANPGFELGGPGEATASPSMPSSPTHAGPTAP
jgi:hypothetical protein